MRLPGMTMRARGGIEQGLGSQAEAGIKYCVFGIAELGPMIASMPEIEESTRLFGPFAKVVGPVVTAVLARSANDKHVFLNFKKVQEGFESRDISKLEYNKLVVLDFLQGCHLGSHLILLRSKKWIQASYLSYCASDLLSWANNTRALIESTADFFSDFYNLSVSVADAKDTMLSFLNGRDDVFVNLGELEKPLEHFFHARKLSKTEREELPDSHRAKQTWEYVKDLERHNMPGLYDLYSELSEISHPSKHSLWNMTILEETAEWKINITGEGDAIREIVDRHSDIFRRFLYYSFLPSLVMLRILVKFKLFSKHPELRRFDFSPYPQWTEIERILNR